MKFIYNDFSNFLTDLNEYQKRFNNHYYKNNTEEIKQLCIYLGQLSNSIQQKN